MTQILARFHRHQQKIADEQKIARIVLESGGLPDEAELTTVSRATLRTAPSASTTGLCITPKRLGKKSPTCSHRRPTRPPTRCTER